MSATPPHPKSVGAATAAIALRTKDRRESAAPSMVMDASTLSDEDIKTIVNGVAVANYNGSERLNDAAHQRHRVGLTGHIGLQIHSGKHLLIRFKDIEVRELE